MFKFTLMSPDTSFDYTRRAQIRTIAVVYESVVPNILIVET